MQPLIASRDGDRFQLIAGERRLRAAEMAGLTTVPLIVRQAEEQQQLELALVENIQRRNLNPIEEAVSYQRLIDEFNLTQEAVAKRVGKSRTVITNNLRLLALPTEIQKALVDGKISYSTARVIVGLPAEKRLEFFRDALKNLIIRHRLIVVFSGKLVGFSGAGITLGPLEYLFNRKENESDWVLDGPTSFAVLYF